MRVGVRVRFLDGKRSAWVALAALGGTRVAWAEPAAAPEAAPLATPTSSPPSGFSGREPLSPEDYRAKREGGYFTGLPLANYDSNTGLGLGLRGYYYFDDRDTEEDGVGFDGHGNYVSWMDHPSLPKFNLESAELREDAKKRFA